MRLPNDPSQKGIVDPKMFPPDPAVVARAREAIVELEARLASTEGRRERWEIRKALRAAKSAAKHGVERRHRGAHY